LDVGANAFIGNLDPEIDEKLLYDTFSAFGVILQTPKVCMCAVKIIWLFTKEIKYITALYGKYRTKTTALCVLYTQLNFIVCI